MKLVINGELKEVMASALDVVMLEIGAYEIKAAVALNGQFISKSQHSTVFLKENDHLEILTPMQGG